MAKKKPRKAHPEAAPDAAAAEARSLPVDAGTPVLVGVTLTTAALAAMASFLPATRLWGINHLAFLPAPVRIGALALLALMFVPGVAVALYRGALALGERAAGPRTHARTVTIVAIALAAVAAFHVFHSATNLLGDGQLIVQSFEAAEEGHDRVIMRSAHAIVTEESIAPGTTLLYYGAVKALKRFGRTPLDSMRALNCVLGGLFVVITLLAASSRSLARDVRVWMVILGFFSSSMLLFFGYIENYTAPYLFLLLYVIACFRALHRQGSAWLPILPLACAIYAHVQCV
ncbi:MAG TPA: hypothetical protein VFX92_13085, partial [Candidatus Krumholzibacteria bacterium]|nr:hypothetical protein [Candidatus Krumholzibacteria bacterium]